VTNALVSLGRKELNAMIEREEAIEVTCEFCREVYAFSREEVSGLIGELH